MNRVDLSGPRQKVIALFNRTELREGESVIDNRDSAIANELGLTLAFVSATLVNYLEEKFVLINKRNIFIDVNTVAVDYEIAKKRIESLEVSLAKSKQKYNNLLHRHQTVNRSLDRLKVCKEMVLGRFTTNEITSALGYRNRTTLYDFIKREKGITFNQYKQQLLKQGKVIIN